MKKAKDTVAPVALTKQSLPMHGLYGILLLFVFASIAYSTYVVSLGTDGIIPKVMLVPQAAFAVLIAIYKFSK